MRLLIFSLQHKRIKKKIRGYKTIHTFTKRIEDKTTDNNNNINSINNNNNNNNDNNSNNNDKTKTKNIKSTDPIKEKKLKTNQKRIPLFC